VLVACVVQAAIACGGRDVTFADRDAGDPDAIPIPPADAGPPDAIPPAVCDSTLPVCLRGSVGDAVEGPAELPGVRVSILDGPGQATLSDGTGRWAIDGFSVGDRVVVRHEADGYLPHLTPSFRVRSDPAAQMDLLLMPMLHEAGLVAYGDSVGVTVRIDRAHLAVQIGDLGGAGGPIVGATYALHTAGGDPWDCQGPFYLDENRRPDPLLTATTIHSYAMFMNCVPPAAEDDLAYVTVSHPDVVGCTWLGGPAPAEMRLVAGTAAFVYLGCEVQPP
jgi:hypothetical protein